MLLGHQSLRIDNWEHQAEIAMSQGVDGPRCRDARCVA
jgi:hypothetical protein